MNTILTPTSIPPVPTAAPTPPLLPEHLKIIIESYRQKSQIQKLDESLPTLHVSQALTSIALIYEKIRTAIDFKAEHLLRRNAIERILRRRFLTTTLGPQKTASGLLKELIWGHYLANDTIPTNRVTTIATILDKYATLKEKLSGSRNGVFSRHDDLILGMMTAEIDDAIVNKIDQEAWVSALTLWFETNYTWDDTLSPEEKETLFHIAIRRAFLKSDEQTLNYHLFLRQFPQWSTHSPDAIDQAASQFLSWEQNTTAYLHHPASNRLFRFIQKHTPPFFVLREVIEQNLGNTDEVFSNTEKLTQKIREVCLRRYHQIRSKVQQGIVRSVIYILATKVVFAFLLEVPYDMWALHRISWLPVGVNVAFPPLLMIILSFFIHTPGEENTQRIIQRIFAFAYPPTNAEKVHFHVIAENRNQSFSVFTMLYAAFFLAIFGAVSFGLSQLDFSPVSIGIFFFFASLVLLFGFRVSWTAQELRVTPEHEGFLQSLINILSLPFIDLGVRLSVGLSKLNILMFILDFLIEAPLKLIIDVISEFANFIRQKREEAIEVPL